MAYHETALDAIFEDSLSDSQFEEGEIAEPHQTVVESNAMDVDNIHGQNIIAEEGEIVEDDPPSGALLDRSEEHGIVEFGEVKDHHANRDTGLGKGLARPSQQKKSKKRRSGKRAKGVNVPQFVKETCNRLQEKKYPLVWAAVKKLGVHGVQNLVKEVDVIEKCGGQMTNDGKRRRTPGGVMWNIMRSRVDPAIYKEIMSQANEVQKQKVKEAKESLKRTRMDVDEPVCNKRQKLVANEVDVSAQVAHGNQTKQAHQRLKPVKVLDVTDGPQRDNSLLPASQLQRAWVEGLRKKESINRSAGSPPGPVGAHFEYLKVGSVADVLPEKKGVPLSERLRAPVEYGDLVKEKKPAPLSESQMVQIEHNDLLQGSFCEGFSTQDTEQAGE